MKLTLHTELPPDTYDRQTRKLQQRTMRFSIDGWQLMATNLQDALDEAEQMGEVVDGVEVEH